MKINISHQDLQKQGVYEIKCLVTGEFYIGCANRSFGIRAYSHLADYAKDIKPKALYKAMRDFGIENFEMNIHTLVSDNTEALKLEYVLIRDLKPSFNGTHVNQNHTPESNKRISQSMPNRKPVIQLDLNGIEIKKWDCIRDVQNMLKYDSGAISKVCRGVYRFKSAYGYLWKYG